ALRTVTWGATIDAVTLARSALLGDRGKVPLRHFGRSPSPSRAEGYRHGPTRSYCDAARCRFDSGARRQRITLGPRSVQDRKYRAALHADDDPERQEGLYHPRIGPAGHGYHLQALAPSSSARSCSARSCSCHLRSCCSHRFWSCSFFRPKSLPTLHLAFGEILERSLGTFLGRVGEAPTMPAGLLSHLLATMEH